MTSNEIKRTLCWAMVVLHLLSIVSVAYAGIFDIGHMSMACCDAPAVQHDSDRSVDCDKHCSDGSGMTECISCSTCVNSIFLMNLSSVQLGKVAPKFDNPQDRYKNFLPAIELKPPQRIL